jgi:hypothetical protein
MVRPWKCAAGLLAVLLVAAPASAQVVHSVQFGFGAFFPRGFDARDADDVLVRNIVGEVIPGIELFPGEPPVTDALFFEVRDFRTGQVFGEWNIAFGPRVEVSAGVGFYRRTVPTFYFDLEDENGLNIHQRLGLRVVPLTGLVRFLPFGRPGDVQPYLGAGVSALNFRYSEIGEFVDPSNGNIFDGRFVKRGTAAAGVLLGGLRIPINGDIYALTIEGRYQFGVGDTGGEAEGFLADKIDLSGGQLNFGFLVRF